jgi:signal transduction histidine kinase
VTVTVEGDQRPLSAEADHSAYRILQESLTNVLRHAGPGVPHLYRAGQRLVSCARREERHGGRAGRF